jgi:hypothetical protein
MNDVDRQRVRCGKSPFSVGLILQEHRDRTVRDKNQGEKIAIWKLIGPGRMGARANRAGRRQSHSAAPAYLLC